MAAQLGRWEFWRTHVEAWREWVRFFDVLQVNEDELALLARAWGDPWRFAAEVVGESVRLLIVTLGSRGAAYVAAPDLDPGAQYGVRIVYSSACPDIKVRLEANDGIEVHPFILKKKPRGPMEFSIPKEATAGGKLILRWYREPGYGSIGTGCDVSEVWLIRE